MARSIELRRAPNGALPVVTARPLVLVIDPDVTSRSVLEVALGRSGFEVLATAAGPQAQTLLRTGATPEVVVLEAELGGEDGISFVAELRGQPSTAQVPVLLLTRAGRPQVEALAEVVGVDGLVRTPAYARDVVALVQVHQRRRGGLVRTVGFTATELPPPLLLRALLCTPSSGRLSLEGGASQVAFRDGEVVSMRSPRGTGLEALSRALALTQGPHTLTLEPVEGPAEISCGLRELLSNVLPRLTRWSQVQQKSLPLDSRLVVDFPRLAASLDTLPDGVNRLVQLFDGFRSLEQVISDSPYNETLSLEIATRLYLMGVVTPAPGGGRAPQGTPRLFEPEGGASKELMNELFSGREGRALEPLPPPRLEDWFQEPQGAGLDLSDPDGGWTTAPASVLAGMPPGFPVRAETERKELAPEARELGRFVRGEEEVRVSLDRAFQELAAAIGRPAEPEPEPVPDVTPPSRRTAEIRGAVLGQVKLEKRAVAADSPEVEAARVEAAKAWVRGEARAALPTATAAAEGTPAGKAEHEEVTVLAEPPARAPEARMAGQGSAGQRAQPPPAGKAEAATERELPALASAPAGERRRGGSEPAAPERRSAPKAEAPWTPPAQDLPPTLAERALASSRRPEPEKAPAARELPAAAPQRAAAAREKVPAAPGKTLPGREKAAAAPEKVPAARERADAAPARTAAAAARPEPEVTHPEDLPAVLYGAWPGRPTPVPSDQAVTVIEPPRPAAAEVTTLTEAAPAPDPEAAFFSGAATTSGDALAPDAARTPDAAVDTTGPQPPLPSRRVGWLAAAGVAVLALLLAIGLTGRGAEQPAPPAPPPPAPVAVQPPPAAAPEPEPEPAAEPPVDVAENLKLAQGFYESGQYARATSVLEQVVLDAPKSVDAWMLLGLVRFDAHDGAGARAAAEKVLAIEPRNARVQILLASMYFEAKESDAARAALNRYLELDPRGQFADEAEKLLRRQP